MCLRGMGTWVQVFKEASGIRFLEAGVTGGCDPPERYAGNGTQASGEVHALNH